MTAGYSGTPLWKKLGFRPGLKVCVLKAPGNYIDLTDGPNDWVIVRAPKVADLLHLFIIERHELEEIGTLAALLPPVMVMWVSWPKKTSSLSNGLTQGDIRKAAIACGLVDTKLCAVDADWSGLKLTRRKG